MSEDNRITLCPVCNNRTMAVNGQKRDGNKIVKISPGLNVCTVCNIIIPRNKNLKFWDGKECVSVRLEPVSVYN